MRTLTLRTSVFALAIAACSGEPGSEPTDAGPVTAPDSGPADALDAVFGGGTGDVDDAATSDANEDAAPQDAADTVEPDDATPDAWKPPQDTGTAPDLWEPPPPPDLDHDGVPDEADLFPSDPNKPGTAFGGLVYAQTADELWTMDVKTYKLSFQAFFGWPSDGNLHEMTDIAIDRYGVLYGVSFSALYTCHPQSGACDRVGTLPSSYNALTFVPAGLLDEDADVLVAIGGGGEWTRFDRQGDQMIPTVLGSYGDLYSSSGDAFSIAGVGTYATVNKDGEDDDWLVAVHPASGHVTAEIGRMNGFSRLYGLAGWTDRVFGFDETGAVLVVDTTIGQVVNTIQTTPKTWWGAAVRTTIPPSK
jgi:hypothetical protein